MTNLDDDALDQLRESVRTDVAAGYDEPDEIVENAVDWIADDLAPDLPEQAARRLVRQLVDEELAAHRARQEQWPPITDYDRLANAFAELTVAGIVAVEHFTCCGTCGATEIWEEVREHGEGARGYAFFHMQDTEHAVAGYGLYLSYGSTSRTEADALEVASEIVETLRRHDLAATWTGDSATRILVPMDWKRRR